MTTVSLAARALAARALAASAARAAAAVVAWVASVSSVAPSSPGVARLVSPATVPEPRRADSYSPTEPNTGSPADAARDREPASPDTIESRLLLTSASRDRSRKFIREVAIREP